MEQHELGPLILIAHGLEIRAPDVFGAGQDRGDESDLRVVRVRRVALARRRRSGLLAGIGAATAEEQVHDQGPRLREDQRDDDDDDRAADAEVESAEAHPAAATTESATTAAAIVLNDVVALPTWHP